VASDLLEQRGAGYSAVVPDRVAATTVRGLLDLPEQA
jgi:hypothetical protein